MSMEIPKRKIGDHVRIMQTSEMEKRGLANMRGNVVDILEEDDMYGQLCLVEFGNKDALRGILIWSSSLCGMKGESE